MFALGNICFHCSSECLKNGLWTFDFGRSLSWRFFIRPLDRCVCRPTACTILFAPWLWCIHSNSCRQLYFVYAPPYKRQTKPTQTKTPLSVNVSNKVLCDNVRVNTTRLVRAEPGLQYAKQVQINSPRSLRREQRVCSNIFKSKIKFIPNVIQSTKRTHTYFIFSQTSVYAHPD